MKFNLNNYLLFVTGFEGFLGSKLVEFLLDNGATVVGLRFNTQEKKEKINFFSKYNNFYLRYFDENIDDLLLDEKTKNHDKAFFHFAGVANAGECQNDPELAYKGNVLLTLQVLEFCRSVNINRFIFPSTGYVYGSSLDKPADEMNRLISTNIYTSTKIASESLIESYGNYHGMSCSVGRISNVFGKESSTETVSGKIIDSVKKGQKITLNTIKPVRDFIYVNDVINAFLAILVSKSEGGCSYYNISTGVDTSIEQLAKIACKLANLPYDYIESKNIKQYSSTCLVLDNSKIKKETNWVPEHSLESGLFKIINEVNE